MRLAMGDCILNRSSNYDVEKFDSMAMTLKKKILVSLLLLVAILAGGSFAIDKLLQVDTYKAQIIAAMQRELQRDVRYATGKFTWRYGPSFLFTNVEILQKGGAGTMLAAEKLAFRISFLPLLERKVVLKRLLLDGPKLLLVRDRAGAWNIDDLLNQKKGDSPLQISGIRIKNGTLRVIDRKMAPEKEMTLADLQMSLRHLSRGKNCTFKISSLLSEGDRKIGTFSVSGKAAIAPADKPIQETAVDAHVVAKGIPADAFWPYYQQYVPFKKVIGQVSIDSTFKGQFTRFTSRGELHVENVTFDYPQVFHAVLSPKAVRAKYDMELTPDDISVSSIDLTVDDFRVKGSCALRDIRSGDLRIAARASTSTFQLEKYHVYIPYGIIVDGTADFIEQHIKGGVYRLDEGRLDGRVSQIAHMEQGENYKVLYIRGRVEKGIVSFGPEVPVFNNVAGELEMKGKDFNLNGMSGSFGTSPFALNGKITDYPLNKPSGYPFAMVMSPRQPEVAWLFDRQKEGKLSFSGPSTLKLTGDGFTSGYNLSGEWDLTTTFFSYPAIISKPAGRPNHLTFKGSINDQEARLASLNASLGSLNVAASARYRFAEKQQLSCDIRTNRFAAAEIAPLIPKIAQYHPSGTVQATINGTSKRNDIKNIHWAGNVSFTNASFKPTETVGLLSNVTGTVHFDGETLQTSYMTVKLGNSTISGKGMLNGFRSPEFSLDFTSPSVLLPDIGLRVPAGTVHITQVSGNVSLKNNNLHIKSLAAKVNDSALKIQGSIIDLRHPRADLSIDAHHLDMKDILAMAEVEPIRKPGGPPLRVAIRASVSASSAKAAGLTAEKVIATISYEDKILYLQPLDCTLYGGRANVRGRFDLTTGGAPRHQVTYSLEGVSTENVTKALGIAARDISGTLSVSGDLTAKGSTSSDLRKTALGSVSLRIEDGSVRKFPVLSKVFSLLNVSQLLKGQLPDMISGGMPFNTITGTLAVREGMVSTQDLFMDSDAINVSAVGTFDLVRNELDITIGAQPLQTVDKVVNRLPIVGWILTGNNNAFLTAYFEAKGKIDDPTVKTIPVKSMSKGAFNIFKRLFQLPAKLITDTGEVILGN